MDLNRWQTFKELALQALEVCGATIHFRGEGYGVHNGVSESSYTLVASTEGGTETLKSILASLARLYNQESIALTVGETEFVGIFTGR